MSHAANKTAFLLRAFILNTHSVPAAPLHSLLPMLIARCAAQWIDAPRMGTSSVPTNAVSPYGPAAPACARACY
jgi:hypothetical protein